MAFILVLLRALMPAHCSGSAAVAPGRSVNRTTEGQSVSSLRGGSSRADHPGPYDAGMRLCDVLGLRWSLTHGVLEENGGTRSVNRNLLARMALAAAAILLALLQP